MEWRPRAVTGGKYGRRGGNVRHTRCSILTFTIVVVLKLQHLLSSSWWIVFCPLWLFHISVARGRFSIPNPSHLDGDPMWIPFHAVVGTPLLIAFELLLCIYLETSHAVNLKMVFLPIYLLETIILLDNLKMCYPTILSQGPMTDREYIIALEDRGWQLETGYIHIPACLIIFLTLCATYNLVEVLIDPSPAKRDYWDSFYIFGFGQVYAYIVFFIYISEDRKDQNWGRVCIGSHVMMVSVFVFLVLLYMHLEGIRTRARVIPIPYVFSPLLLLQGLGVVFSTSLLVERVLQLHQVGIWRHFIVSSTTHEYLECMHHGLGLIGWWSHYEASEEARTHQIHSTNAKKSTTNEGCTTFCGNPPELVKKMSKEDLVAEVLNLQTEIDMQMNVTKSALQEYEFLQFEKILCRICFVREIEVVLFPCKHHILCSECCGKVLNCPYCLASITSRLNLYNPKR